MPANYDSIAQVYDLTSRLVFGKAIIRAQECMLGYIQPDSNILIVGGGTGWILESISDLYPQGLYIDYVEASAQMIDLSKKRNCKDNKVNFIHLPIENFSTDKQYDVIITPFIFDNFSADKIELVFTKLDDRLKSNGLWLYTDFVYERSQSKLWQKILLKVMYLFFRITSGIETQELISMESYFAPSYHKEFEASHYFKFIQSIVYRKL